MASTGPESNDDRQHSSPQNASNPFVRFKRFADAQAAIVLTGMQSIIGLPSSLKRPTTTDEHARWNDWEEFMKQRDELKARHRSRKSLDSTKAPDNDKGGVQVDVGASVEQPLSATEALSTEDLEHLKAMDDEGESDGLELYMPVTKALFGHLITELEDRNGCSPFGAHSPHRMPKFMDFLKDDTHSADHMDVVQRRIYDKLSNAPCPIRKLTTIPYIVFSQYSPLRLTHQMPVQSIGSRVQGPNEIFPYAAAFEDLLLISQGREMTSLEDRAVTSGMVGFWRNWNETTVGDRTKAGLGWLVKLNRLGLLWTRVDGHSSWFDHKSARARVASREPSTVSQPATELDLYDMMTKALNNGRFPSSEELQSVAEAVERTVEKARHDIQSVFSSQRSSGTQTDDVTERCPTQNILTQGLGMLNQILSLIDGPAEKKPDPNATPPSTKSKAEAVDSKPANQYNLTIRTGDHAQKARDQALFDAGKQNEATELAPHQQDDQTKDEDNKLVSFSSTPETTRRSSNTTSYTLNETSKDGTIISTRVDTITNSDGSITTKKVIERQYADGGFSSSEESRTVYNSESKPQEAALSPPADESTNQNRNQTTDFEREMRAHSAMMQEQMNELRRMTEQIGRLWDADDDDDDDDDAGQDRDDGREADAWEAEGRRIRAERAARAEEEDEERRSSDAEAARKATAPSGKTRGRGWFWE